MSQSFPLSPSCWRSYRKQREEPVVRSIMKSLPVLLPWPESCQSQFWLSAGHWHPLQSRWWGQTSLSCSWHRRWWIGQSRTIAHHLWGQKRDKLIKPRNIPAFPFPRGSLLLSNTEARHWSRLSRPAFGNQGAVLCSYALCLQAVLCPC